MKSAKIVGTGMYAPEKIVDNQFFNDKYKVDIDTFLRTKRNIFQRHYMAEDQATSDLIVPAAREALQNAGLTPEQIDLLIVATDTPDYLSPSTASVVQFKLGLKNAGTFDLNAACAGFVTALDVASKYIKSDSRYKNVLVVGAYGMTKYLNWDDYKIASLFADGAGAVVLQASDDPADKDIGVLSSQMYSDGQYHDYMGIYGGGTYRPVTQDVIEKKKHLLDFSKKIPLEINGNEWTRLANVVLDRAGARPGDAKYYFITQINIQSIYEVMDKLGVDRSRSYNIMDRYGYTGSGCIPMAIADAVKQHKLKRGDLIVMVGSGGGLSMASMALRWGYDT